MSESMNGSPFEDATFSYGCAESFLKTTLMHWFCVLMPRREEPDRVAMNAPVMTQHIQAGIRERHIAIFVAFGLMNVQHFTLTIDVTDFQARSFQQAQATGIDRGQANAVMMKLHSLENTAYFFHTQHDWQLLFFLGAQEVKGLPFPAERMLEEELDPA